MPINPKIFKAYDIRGLAPQELDADAAYRIGQAVVKFTGAATVVVGKDMRGTTPELFEALARGIMGQGADVIDIGRVTTPMFYFAVGHYELHDAGVMVTASHNPAEYNGMKLCFGDVVPIGGNNGMGAVRDLALAGPYPERPSGTMVTADVKADYFAKLFERIDPKAIAPLKAVVDAGNGMEGEIIRDFFAALPQVEMSGMYLEPDGTFPNHEANPLKTETLDDLRAAVRDSRADVGFAFDGDGDRMGLIDELGNVVPGDILLALMAERLLRDHPGETIAYTVNCSMTVAEAVERAGGKLIMTPVGHGLIKPIMREHGALFGGEISYHYYFRDMFTSESTDLMVLLVLQMMTEEGKPLSEILAPYRRYHQSEEINSEVADKDAVLAALGAKYAPLASKVVTIDGVRMEFMSSADPDEHWWFNVRASNTEPLLRLKLEAKTAAALHARTEELLALIRA
jgi:phosphomannomutase